MDVAISVVEGFLFCCTLSWESPLPLHTTHKTSKIRDIDSLLRLKYTGSSWREQHFIDQPHLHFLCIQLFVDLHGTSSCPLSLDISTELSFTVSWFDFSLKCCFTFSMHLWVCNYQQDPNPSLPFLQALILPLASQEASFLFKPSIFIKDSCLLFPFIVSCTDKFWINNLIK